MGEIVGPTLQVHMSFTALVRTPFLLLTTTTMYPGLGEIGCCQDDYDKRIRREGIQRWRRYKRYVRRLREMIAIEDTSHIFTVIS